MNEFEPLPTAIRAHIARDRAVSPARPIVERDALRRSTVVFDCETTNDATQRLLFGVWRLYIDPIGTDPGTLCHREGIFFADDLPDTDPHAYDTLVRYVRTHRADVAPGCRSRLQLLSRSEFVEQILWRWGHQQTATIVGYNLPFDLTRLALFASRGRRWNRDGISLCLWNHDGSPNIFRPRVTVKQIDAHRSLIQFTSYKDAPEHPYRGKFLDLHTHAFALTDRRELSLEAACAHFGVEFTKADVTHGAVTDRYIDYCRADVAATASLYTATSLEQRRHPIKLTSHHTYSPATIGKAYLEAIGIEPFADRELYIDNEIAGWGMAAFFGGRSECRIRHLEVPVVYVDFASMYPTCNALMNTWTLLCSDFLTVSDNTREVRALATAPNLRERLFQRSTWPIMHTLVEVDPNGSTLPVRALYDGETWGLGVNPYESGRACWYSLADVLAAHLHPGPNPIVRRSVRLHPGGAVNGLRTVQLLGEIRFNPKRDDLFATLVEQRHRIQRDPSLAPQRRTELVAWLKVLANATGFGIFAETRRTRTRHRVDIDVWSDTHLPITSTTTEPEDPGKYSASPIAACLTGAARLMLTLLEDQVAARGGTYAFCDTDSMAIVATQHGQTLACPGGSSATSDGQPAITALEWNDVHDIVSEFEQLNPYDRTHVPGSILRIESENYDDTNGTQHELRCWAISAKRYVLRNLAGEALKRSEHGLGHLLNPTCTEGVDWITQGWNYIQHPDDTERPDWWDLPAVSKVSVTGPEMLNWFHFVNLDKPYADQIKPANFLLVAHPDPLNAHPTQHPVAPFNKDPHTWMHAQWVDRHSGLPTVITTNPLDGQLRAHRCRVRTYGDILELYRTHPEPKSLSADRSPMDASATGLLKPRPVSATPIQRRIGKEAHDLERRITGLTDSLDVQEHAQSNLDIWNLLAVPVLATLKTRDTARATGVHIRTVQRAVALKGCVPRTLDRHALTRYAATHARFTVHAARHETDEIVFTRYLAHVTGPNLT